MLSLTLFYEGGNWDCLIPVLESSTLTSLSLFSGLPLSKDFAKALGKNRELRSLTLHRQPPLRAESIRVVCQAVRKLRTLQTLSWQLSGKEKVKWPRHKEARLFPSSLTTLNLMNVQLWHRFESPHLLHLRLFSCTASASHFGALPRLVHLQTGLRACTDLSEVSFPALRWAKIRTRDVDVMTRLENFVAASPKLEHLTWHADTADHLPLSLPKTLFELPHLRTLDLKFPIDLATALQIDSKTHSCLHDIGISNWEDECLLRDVRPTVEQIFETRLAYWRLISFSMRFEHANKGHVFRSSVYPLLNTNFLSYFKDRGATPKLKLVQDVTTRFDWIVTRKRLR